MKVASIVELLLTNLILLFLYSAVAQDYGLRSDYWRSIGYNPSFAYAPLVLVLSAVNRGATIPGLLTFDWSQFLLIALIVVDGVFALETILRRTSNSPRYS